MIRFFCIILFLLLFSIISLPMYLIVNIIGHFSPMKKAKISLLYAGKKQYGLCFQKGNGKGALYQPMDALYQLSVSG